VRLAPADEAKLTVVEIAVLIERGWLTDWPHEWHKRATRLIRSGRAEIMWQSIIRLVGPRK
jgi:hypothetical protein